MKARSVVDAVILVLAAFGTVRLIGLLYLALR